MKKKDNRRASPTIAVGGKIQKFPAKKKKTFPKKFPFWARFKVNKKRTTLVIDEERIREQRSGKVCASGGDTHKQEGL